MGFGNPYGEEWNAEIVIKWVKRLAEMGTQIIALSDTVGWATLRTLKKKNLVSGIDSEIPRVEFGGIIFIHPLTWMEKSRSCFHERMQKIWLALKGIGGCPMANDALVGNLATENVVAYFKGQEGPWSGWFNLQRVHDPWLLRFFFIDFSATFPLNTFRIRWWIVEKDCWFSSDSFCYSGFRLNLHQNKKAVFPLSIHEQTHQKQRFLVLNLVLFLSFCLNCPSLSELDMFRWMAKSDK